MIAYRPGERTCLHPLTLLIMASIDRRPAYEQLADLLADQIERGELAAGQILPSEPYLSGEYGLSRSTVRVALQLLRERGLIITKPGLGSYVAER